METVYYDKDLAVVIKPVGLDSEEGVPEAIRQTLGGECFPVHRLDKNVGGLMVYARSKAAAAALSRAVQEGSFVKHYYACVHGSAPAEGGWEDLLFKDSSKNKVFIVKKERRGVKKARLTFRKLDEKDGLSLVKIRLYTGRSHQIRVQFASRQLPLAGDGKYGGRDRFASPMLFSCQLDFPWKGKQMHFSAAPLWAENEILSTETI